MISARCLISSMTSSGINSAITLPQLHDGDRRAAFVEPRSPEPLHPPMPLEMALDRLSQLPGPHPMDDVDPVILPDEGVIEKLVHLGQGFIYPQADHIQLPQHGAIRCLQGTGKGCFLPMVPAFRASGDEPQFLQGGLDPYAADGNLRS